MAVEGGCFCRAVRYRIEGVPRRVTHCHCLHCRQTSGAPFLTWAEFDFASFTIVAGAPARFESRPLVTRQFCGSCGTQLTYQNAETSGSIDVTACSLDRPDAVTPEDHVWAVRVLPWMKLDDGLPRYKRGRNDP